MKVLIVEDEVPASRRLASLVKEIDEDIEVMGIIDSISQAVIWLKQKPQPDLILLDIELSDGQSFEIFNQVEVQSAIIFTTAYDEFALKAFKVNSIDYILKPIDKELLSKAILKYKNFKIGFGSKIIDIQKLMDSFHIKQEYKARFLVKQGDKLFTVDTNQIAYIISEDKLSFIISNQNKKYLVDGTLDELERKLDPKLFFRINRQIIASINSIESSYTHLNGKIKITLNPKPEEEVFISREKATEFKKWLDS